MRQSVDGLVDVAGAITEGGTVSEIGSITFTDLDLTDLPTATEATTFRYHGPDADGSTTSGDRECLYD